MRTLLLVVVLFAARPSSADPVAGDFDQLDESQLVRVYTPTHVFLGLYRGRSGDHITLETDRGLKSLSLASIEKVDQARSSFARSTLLGAGIGALTGAATPFLASSLFHGECCHFDGGFFLAAVAVGAGLGAAIGAIAAPASLRWREWKGSSFGPRALGSRAPHIVSIAVHGGASRFGAVPPTHDDGPVERVKDQRGTYDVNVMYRHLVPGEVGISVLYTSYERFSDISPAPTDSVFVLGPEYRLPLLRGPIEPYVGAGFKYITSEASSTTKGRQRALGFDAVAGVRWTPGNQTRVFLDGEARGAKAVHVLAGTTHHRIVTYGMGLGLRY